MVRKIAIVLLMIAVLALLGLGYLQFTNDSVYVLAVDVPRYHQFGAEDISEQRMAKLRDEKLKQLVITTPGQIVGKYAGREMKAGEILVNNGALLDTLPPGRCFSTGRCLEDNQTAWILTADTVDTVGGRVGPDDYVDIVLIDAERKKLTFFIQKIKALEVNAGEFLFGFSPEQVAVLRGIQAEGKVRLGLLLSQEPNELQEQFKQYSMDYAQVSRELFPLPTPTATPATPAPTPTATPGGPQ